MTDPRPDAARPEVPAQIRHGRLVAIARGLPADGLVDVAAALHEGGMRVFEVTLSSPDALAGIAAVSDAQRRHGPDGLLVGAGTVLSIEEATAALDAGAQFIVMPHVDAELVGWAAARGIPAFPGAMTPTEIVRAWRAGAAAVKIFPASVLGPAFVREVRGPLAAIPLIPSGGITAASAPAFISAGAAAVGLGGWLTGSGDVETIRARAAQAVAAVEPTGRADPG